MGRVWVGSAGVAQHYLSATPSCQMFSNFLRIPKSACTDSTCGSLASYDDLSSSSKWSRCHSSTGKRLRMTLWIHLHVRPQMSQVWRQTKISDQKSSSRKRSPTSLLNEEFWIREALNPREPRSRSSRCCSERSERNCWFLRMQRMLSWLMLTSYERDVGDWGGWVLEYFWYKIPLCSRWEQGPHFW